MMEEKRLPETAEKMWERISVLVWITISPILQVLDLISGRRLKENKVLQDHKEQRDHKGRRGHQEEG